MIYEIKTTLVPIGSVGEEVSCVSPSAVHKFLLRDPLPAVEMFHVLFLNGRHRIISKMLISIGTLNTAIVHPRDVFGPALRLGTTSAIIVAHNHPSGDVSPSPQDLALTRRLRKVGELVGISLVDHLIYSDSEYKSLREECGW